MAFQACIGYLITIGILSHFYGEALSRDRFNGDAFPFHCAAWERGGAVYENLAIRSWKDHLPDMSRIMPDMLPKRICGGTTAEGVGRLIQESCVAELIHVLLIFASFGCMAIWPGKGGVLVTLLWMLGNVPYILIQRYNRPRLKRLARRLGAKVEHESALKHADEPLRNTTGG